MKKICIVLACSLFVICSYGQEFEKGNFILHAGAGTIPNSSDESNGTPFGGSLEYLYSDSFGAGIFFTFHDGSDSDPDIGYSYNGFEVDLRHSFHFPLSDVFEANIGAFFGYDFVSSQHNNPATDILTIPESSGSFGIAGGANYMLGENFGLFVDGMLNFSTSLENCVLGGITLKF